MKTQCLENIPLPAPADKEFIQSLKISEEVKALIFDVPEVGARSERQYRVIADLMEAGCKEKTIRFILNTYPIGDKCREKGAEWRDQEIERVKAKVKTPKRVVRISENMDLLSMLEASIVPLSKFLKEKIPEPKVYLSDWLVESSVNLIYAGDGVGKSWLSIIIAALLTSRLELKDLPPIGPWKIENKTGVLLVDGEMPESLLQGRLDAVTKYLGEGSGSKPFPLRILSDNRLNRQFDAGISISTAEGRDAIFNYLMKRRNIKVLVLDNISALTSALDENRNTAWDSLKGWVKSLKHKGIAVILIHHAGKKGDYRGSSTLADQIDTRIKLKPVSQKATEAYFNVMFEKARRAIPGSGQSWYPFNLRIVSMGSKGVTWTMEKKEEKPDNIAIVALLLDGKLNQTQIADIFEVSKQIIGNRKKEAVKKGLMDEKRNPTKKGKKFLDECDVDLSVYYEEEE